MINSSHASAARDGVFKKVRSSLIMSAAMDFTRKFLPQLLRQASDYIVTSKSALLLHTLQTLATLKTQPGVNRVKEMRREVYRVHGGPWAHGLRDPPFHEQSCAIDRLEQSILVEEVRATTLRPLQLHPGVVPRLEQMVLLELFD
mmetsp:Transcript_3825/g.8929  ORF Transcript_3825/g.8929 Transcript_3825/m.8929 type:complete len:145 (+) Transcript_3825:212-646(+)